METPKQFDLNAALRDWRGGLGQSPKFRDENLDELESHLRDSLRLLEEQGLTAGEAFLIGTRRVGSPAGLEAEFALENGACGWRGKLSNHMNTNKAIHVLIFSYFTLGCWFLWGILKVSTMETILLQRLQHSQLPAFTQLWLGLMPLWYVPAILAGIYCVVACLRKAGISRSWVGFFATTTAVLVLLAFPVLIAAGLPVISLLNQGIVPR